MATAAIRLNKPNFVYSDGDVMTGSVQLNLPKPFQNGFMRVKLYGIAKTDWKTTRHHSEPVYYWSDGQQRISHYKEWTTHEYFGANICYVDERVTLWSPKKNGDSLRGTHNFQFSIKIPDVCLPTFEGKHHDISYSLEVALVTSKGQLQDKWTKCIKLAPSLNLNQNPSHKAPSREAQRRGVKWCCCFNRGVIGMESTIPCRGFVPGEQIKISCSIQNDTSLKVIKLRAKLYSNMFLHGKKDGSDKVETYEESKNNYYGELGPHEKTYHTMVEKELSIEPHSSYSTDITVNVPICMQTITNCPIISLYHGLSVTCFLEEASIGAYIDAYAKNRYKIIIGAVPYKSETGRDSTGGRETKSWNKDRVEEVERSLEERWNEEIKEIMEEEVKRRLEEMKDKKNEEEKGRLKWRSETSGSANGEERWS